MSDRRTFLKSAMAGTLLVGLDNIAKASEGKPAVEQWISIIDLDRCNGCTDRPVPACVSACKQENQTRFPEPIKPLQPYWPQKKFEDFSNDRERTDRLTPYNWLFVEKIRLSEEGFFPLEYLFRKVWAAFGCFWILQEYPLFHQVSGFYLCLCLL